MNIKTKRWCDEKNQDDGWRLLVTRYRPRGLIKKHETWDSWFSELAPSKKLHAARRGKSGHPPISWKRYCLRYFKEMQRKEAKDLIICLAKIVEAGEPLTLLCSSACLEAKYCHRSLLKKLIINQIKLMQKKYHAT